MELVNVVPTRIREYHDLDVGRCGTGQGSGNTVSTVLY